MLTFDEIPGFPKMRGARFESIADWADFAATPAVAKNRHMRDAGDWYGAAPADMPRRMASGDADLTAACDDMLSGMEQAAEFATSRHTTVAAVAGGVPCVPAYLAGSPLAMRRRVRVIDDAAPLAVVVDIGVSASVTADTIRRRGAAALALVRLLSVTRPVSLWVVTGQVTCRYDDARRRDVACAIQIDTAPLDVSRAAWLLCAPDAFRRVFFATSLALAGNATEGDINWLFNDGKQHGDAIPKIAPFLTGCDEFVLVPRLFTAGETQFATDDAARAWLADMLAQHTGQAVAA